MIANEMLEVISSRKDVVNQVFAKIEYMYEQTEKMLLAIESGKDKDKCFEHWITLIDTMDTESKSDVEYYNYHVLHLVSLIDGWYKSAPKVLSVTTDE